MARELKKTLHEELHGAHALQTMADGLPALGIVAAVLGVIKTMSHIDRPPAVLGAMIGERAVRHVPWRAAGLWPGRSVRQPAEGRGRGGGEVLRGDPRRAGDASARQRAAGQRRVRPQDGAERSTCRHSWNWRRRCSRCRSVSPSPTLPRPGAGEGAGHHVSRFPPPFPRLGGEGAATTPPPPPSAQPRAAPAASGASPPP